YYTNGARLSWFNLQTPVPDFIRRIDKIVPPFRINDTTSTMFSLGQNMFTPEDIENPQEQPDDRPWAAWTYGSVALATRTANHIDQMEFTLGIVGPEALGEQAQKLVHRHFADAPTPKGWRHQLDFEPGVILSWQRRWPEAARWVVGEYAFRAVPNVNASVGNIYTYAGTGLSFTFGPNHSQQDTPPRVRPSMPGTGYFETPQAGWNWQIFASLDGRAVARNIFLDGNSFRDGPSVDKK